MPNHHGGVEGPGPLPRGLTESGEGLIPRDEAERIAATRDRGALALAAYREAFPNPAANINGQAVLDLSTGEVRPSAYVEGHAEDTRFGHLLPLAECEAEIKARLSEEEFVRHVRESRRAATEVAARLDVVYGGSRRAPARPFGRPESPSPA